MGNQEYKPEASLRIIPARNMSWCEMTSASFGVSLNVANKKRLARMETILKLSVIEKSCNSGGKDLSTCEFWHYAMNHGISGKVK
jgi:hypothetical protein